MCMTSQCGHFLHVWVRPYIYLVLGVSVSTDHFMKRFAELQVTYLGASVLGTYYFPCEDVTHFDHPISSSSSSSQKSMLVWRPCQGLNGSLMVAKIINCVTVNIPYKDPIIVTTRSQVLIIFGPLQSTDLLSMFRQSLNKAFRRPQIPLQNALISGPSRQQSPTPSHGPNPDLMPIHPPYLLLLINIPDHYIPLIASDGKRTTLGIPAHGSYRIQAQLAESSHFGSISIPEVDTIAKSDGQLILERPIYQVQVKVIRKGWGVKNFYGIFVNPTWFLKIRRQIRQG